jgi:hypothetical protein
LMVLRSVRPKRYLSWAPRLVLTMAPLHFTRRLPQCLFILTCY